jgi:dTMP kinase
MYKGKFITFEGGEGAGKSSHIKRLSEELRLKNYEVLPTREPGGTPTGEAIRGILQHDHAGEAIEPIAELLLFEAARAQLVGKIIRPALEKGVWVLSDRFIDSSTAYQGYGRGFGYEMIEQANTIAIGDCIPDLTILMDIPVEVGIERLRTRGGELDRMEREARGFREKVRAGYLEIAKRYPERIKVINSNREKDEVYSDISRAVFEKFGL